ncbi:PhzF family phenazine biosynthesis protein [Paraburkholderia sp. BCC1886]|uniref:PhzF family phenazine biosynthesis protein n=1 Tax=Paraburkholderia sp. BCC1886 TaxID=2562670 RepID=UPI0011844A24|nr:PhzF family phenazine biosynthesis isomerase [Paraburkholderia sp. BCC1886]
MLRQYCVKAFSTNPLEGNPAAVVLLRDALPEPLMQRIAFINGFPETVFLRSRSDDSRHYDIRWFTPTREVSNAGHATLAAQYVLAAVAEHDWTSITLHWTDRAPGCERVSNVSREKADVLDCGPAPALRTPGNAAADLGVATKLSCGDDLVLVMDSEDQVKRFDAPLAQLVTLPYRGLCVTAPAARHDYCARFFAPAYGVPEDFVTASAHHYLASFWAQRLDKSVLSAIQHSASPGVLTASVSAGRVELRGSCCIYSIDQLYV